MLQQQKYFQTGRFLHPREETLSILGDQPPADFSSLKRVLNSAYQKQQLNISHGDGGPNYNYKNPDLQSFENLPSLQAAIASFESFMHVRAGNPNFTFFTDLLPKIHSSALRYEELQNYSDSGYGELPLLSSGRHGRVSLTRSHIRTILANAFFMNVMPGYGTLSLMRLYTSMDDLAVQRILCLLAYFAILLSSEEQTKSYPIVASCGDGDGDGNGNGNIDMVSFERHLIQQDESPDWSTMYSSKIDICSVRIHTQQMEDSDALGFMDFANKDLHIHCIIPSATQEEVLFSTCPEAFVGILIADRLGDNEALIIRNVRRYVLHEGYSSTFKFAGFYPCHRVHDILVADATPKEHFTKHMIDRDLIKAYLAFSAFTSLSFRTCSTESSSSSTTTLLRPSESSSKTPTYMVGSDYCLKVSTSHWGCGMFRGDKHLKFLQQVCASSLASVLLDYSTFGNSAIVESFNKLLEIIDKKQHTIASLYKVMCSFDNKKSGSCFFEYLLHTL